MRSFVLSSLLCLLVATPLHAQETKADRLATSIFLSSAAADWASHAYCVQSSRWCQEANPALAWMGRRNVVPHIVVGAAADVAAAYAVNRWIRPRHPRLARVGLIAASVGRIYLAASNVRLARQMSRCQHVTIPAAC